VLPRVACRPHHDLVLAQPLSTRARRARRLECHQFEQHNVAMKERLRRSVVVDAPLEVAWKYLATPEQWPQTWARHIRQVECEPPGPVTATTQAVLRTQEGFTSRLAMVEFHVGQNWKWAGRGRIGPTIAFDHQFKALDENRTRIDFVLETDGFLESLLGRLNALYLGRKLDRNLPRLVADLKGQRQG
jgi:hypothetical protein